MNKSELRNIIKEHECWLNGAGGKQADFSGQNLRGSKLRGVDLRGAILRNADLLAADLRDADLREADLRGAKLWKADLRGVDLRGAKLAEAHLDRVAWPISYGTQDAIVDERFICQLLKHAMSLARISPVDGEIKALLLSSDMEKIVSKHLMRTK